MKITRADDVAWKYVSGHRGGQIEFKTLLDGTEGAPDNYHLSLFKAFADFTAPAHRHNFDQIRMGVVGALNYGPRKDILPGEIAYFPEGLHYGPQEQASQGDSIGLVVQFGGASGQGFMSQRQLNRGFETLKDKGTFADGVFRSNPDHRTPGSANNRDGYEAIWEEVNGRSIEYVAPRYRDPVHMRPDSAAWQPCSAGGAGALTRRLGSFTERAIDVEQLQLPAGTEYVLPLRAGIRLLYALQGTGVCNGEQHWNEGTAIEIAAGEQVKMKATANTTFFILGLPIFSSSAGKATAAA